MCKQIKKINKQLPKYFLLEVFQDWWLSLVLSNMKYALPEIDLEHIFFKNSLF